MKKTAELTLDDNLEIELQVNLKIGEDIINASLPAPLELLESYNQWSSYYDRFAYSSRIREIEESFTNYSSTELNRLARELRDRFNQWLNHPSFYPIKEKFCEHLTPSDEVQVIILTDSPQLCQLPWHEWDVWRGYKIEVALGTTTTQREAKSGRKRTRILAILGNKSGIDVSQDRKLLENLSSDAEVIFLVEPERKILNKNLWDKQGWDILFFAGHSRSESKGTRGRIYFNATDSLTIEELNHGFQKAGERGLQIAIFNSCDGLGIAFELANLNIPQVIVMRKPVPNLVAEEFLKYFLDEFTNGESFYQSVGNARKQLQGLEDQFPCASWLPIIVQNPLSEPPTWKQLCRQTELYSSPKDYRNRQALLYKVKENWVAGVLDSENSLHNRVLIELGLENRLDAVRQPWDMEWETHEQLRKPIPSGTKVIDIFNQIGEGGTLLILGEPGSGKTTTLLELARNLIELAELDDNQPMPIVFNLSSWSNEKSSLTIDNWLIKELYRDYKVPKKLGDFWLKNQQLLLLLDGLDEVKTERRNLCVKAINEFVQLYRQTKIVITSRIEDYKNLSPHRLDFQSAIYLQPLTSVQIDRYFNSAGSQLSVVQTLWREDSTLQELAKSPLMLNIMTLAYRGMRSEDLPPINALEERRNHLFDHYIKQMFIRRQSSSKQRYSLEDAIDWLTWMAQRMSQESQTVFLIERIQPSWLLNSIQKWVYRIGFVLVTGMIYCLLYNLILIFTNELIYLPIYELFYGSEYRSTTSLIDRMSYRINIPIIRTGLIIAIFNLIYSKLRNQEEIKLFETINFSKKRLWNSFINGIKPGVIVMAIVMIIAIIIQSKELIILSKESINLFPEFNTFDIFFILSIFIFILSIIIYICFLIIIWIIIKLFWRKGNVWKISGVSWLVYMLIGVVGAIINGSFKILFSLFVILLTFTIIVPIYGLVGGLIGGVISALCFGLKGDDLDRRTFPNQGIWNTLINAGVFIIIFGLLFGLIAGLTTWLEEKPFFLEYKGNNSVLSAMLSIGILFGLLFALIPGIPAIKHFTLRVILYCQGYIPWNYARFLNYATERNIFTKSWRWLHLHSSTFIGTFCSDASQRIIALNLVADIYQAEVVDIH